MCAGGWPLHDPARPGAAVPEHPPTLVQPEDQVGTATDRWPRRVPYVITFATNPPLSFGPFPTVLAAIAFVDTTLHRDYTLSGLYRADDVEDLDPPGGGPDPPTAVDPAQESC